MFLTQGASFGETPFITSKYKGTLKTLTASEILVFDKNVLNRFFLSSLKALKSYIKNIQKMGFQLSAPAKEHLGNGSRIITVYSPVGKSGKSTFTAFLGLSLSEHGDTILLDASYKGLSIFEYFGKEVPPPISQKSESDKSSDQLIENSIINVDDKLSLINIASGSRVMVNTDILSPLLFFLSRKYKNIIIDISNDSLELRDDFFSLSDMIFTMLKDVDDGPATYELFDKTIKQGQRVYYVLNRKFSKGTGAFEGGYLFEEIEIDLEEGLQSGISKYIKEKTKNKKDEIISLITSKKSGLVLQTNLYESVFYVALFSSLSMAGTNVDIIYSSFWSFVITLLFLLTGDYSEFENYVKRIFISDKLNFLLDITFPEKYIYKNTKINKFAREIAQNKRIESFRTMPMVMLTESKHLNSRIFSTGYVKDLLTASFGLYPIYESVKIADSLYNSGFPLNSVNPGDLLGTDVDEIIYAKLDNKKTISSKKLNSLPFYKNYIDCLYYTLPVEDAKYTADKVINIEVDAEEPSLKDIAEIEDEILKQLK